MEKLRDPWEVVYVNDGRRDAVISRSWKNFIARIVALRSLTYLANSVGKSR